MGRIFVTSEDPKLDYTPALQYGSSISGVFPPGQIHLHPDVAINQARKILRSMEPDDYLALAGDPTKILICGVIAAERVGKVKILKWNRQSMSYVPIELDFITQQTK